MRAFVNKCKHFHVNMFTAHKRGSLIAGLSQHYLSPRSVWLMACSISCRFQGSLRGRIWPATTWHRMLRSPYVMGAIARCASVALFYAGSPSLRPGKGQGYRQMTDLFTDGSVCPPCFLCGGRVGVRPAELFSGQPHLMHDDREFAGNGDSRLFHACALGDAQAPYLERTPFVDLGQERGRCLVKISSRELVSTF